MHLFMMYGTTTASTYVYCLWQIYDERSLYTVRHSSYVPPSNPQFSISAYKNATIKLLIEKNDAFYGARLALK